MRLFCPNCDAQYEVGEGVIPPEGREVQCSACGHTWFQQALGAVVDMHGDDDDFSGDDDGDSIGAVLDPDPAFAQESRKPVLEDAVGKAIAAIAEPMPSALAQDEAPAPDEEVVAATEAAAPKRRELDDNVLNVLREEAELESRRRREALPVGDSAEEAGLAAAISATVASANTPPSADDPKRISARSGPSFEDMHSVSKSRDLLPDVDTINSTLRASNDRRGADNLPELPPVLEEQKRGFGLGFGSIVAVGLMGFALYIFAPQIGEKMPGMRAPLNSYVAGVDAGRSWLDGAMKSVVDSLRNDDDAPAPGVTPAAPETASTTPAPPAEAATQTPAAAPASAIPVVEPASAPSAAPETAPAELPAVESLQGQPAAPQPTQTDN
ncbi:MAG: zinc-ribbon domain-containing protein [Paracoccaceae bacterium]